MISVNALHATADRHRDLEYRCNHLKFIATAEQETHCQLSRKLMATGVVRDVKRDDSQADTNTASISPSESDQLQKGNT